MTIMVAPPSLWARNDGDGWTRVHQAIGGPGRTRHPVIASYPDGHALGDWLRRVLPTGPSHPDGDPFRPLSSP